MKTNLLLSVVAIFIIAGLSSCGGGGAKKEISFESNGFAVYNEYNEGEKGKNGQPKQEYTGIQIIEFQGKELARGEKSEDFTYDSDALEKVPVWVKFSGDKSDVYLGAKKILGGIDGKVKIGFSPNGIANCKIKESVHIYKGKGSAKDDYLAIIYYNTNEIHFFDKSTEVATVKYKSKAAQEYAEKSGSLNLNFKAENFKIWKSYDKDFNLK